MSDKKTSIWVSWAALGLSAVALVMSLSNKVNVENLQMEEVRMGEEVVEQSPAEEIESQIEALGQNIEGGIDRTQLERGVDDLTANLERAYREVGEGASEGWAQMRVKLEVLGDQVREGSAEALGTLAEVLEQAQADLRQEN